MSIVHSDPLAASDAAKGRLLSERAEPFVTADWEQVTGLHFLLPAERVRPLVPRGLELELHGGRACVSLVAVTMRRFRATRSLSLASLFGLVREQRFLNLRTYVRHGQEPGALFLFGWLSPPMRFDLPMGMLRLPCATASLVYDHNREAGALRGRISAGLGKRCWAFHAELNQGDELAPCAPGSLADFAMERYSGFFQHGSQVRVFRVWHPPWQQVPICATIEETSLVTEKFPWFAQAELAAANFAPGFPGVWLGRAHRLKPPALASRTGHRALSGFYRMP